MNPIVHYLDQNCCHRPITSHAQRGVQSHLLINSGVYFKMGYTISLLPAPTQLFVACSTVKKGVAWNIANNIAYPRISFPHPLRNQGLTVTIEVIVLPGLSTFPYCKRWKAEHGVWGWSYGSTLASKIFYRQRIQVMALQFIFTKWLLVQFPNSTHRARNLVREKIG